MINLKILSFLVKIINNNKILWTIPRVFTINNLITVLIISNLNNPDLRSINLRIFYKLEIILKINKNKPKNNNYYNNNYKNKKNLYNKNDNENKIEYPDNNEIEKNSTKE